MPKNGIAFLLGLVFGQKVLTWAERGVWIGVAVATYSLGKFHS